MSSRAATHVRAAASSSPRTAMNASEIFTTYRYCESRRQKAGKSGTLTALDSRNGPSGNRAGWPKKGTSTSPRVPSARSPCTPTTSPRRSAASSSSDTVGRDRETKRTPSPSRRTHRCNSSAWSGATTTCVGGPTFRQGAAPPATSCPRGPSARSVHPASWPAVRRPPRCRHASCEAPRSVGWSRPGR